VQFTYFVENRAALETVVLRAAEGHVSVLGKHCAVYVLCRNRAVLETVVLRAEERQVSVLGNHCAFYELCIK